MNKYIEVEHRKYNYKVVTNRMEKRNMGQEITLTKKDRNETRNKLATQYEYKTNRHINGNQHISRTNELVKEDSRTKLN